MKRKFLSVKNIIKNVFAFIFIHEVNARMYVKKNNEENKKDSEQENKSENNDNNQSDKDDEEGKKNES